MRPSDLVGPVVVHSGDAIRYANEDFCALVGVESSTEILQESLGEFVTEQYREPLAEQFDRIVHGEVPTLGLRLELEGTNGIRREVIAVSSPVEWDGEMRIHTSFVDVSGANGDRAVSIRENALQAAPIGVTIADATREDEPLVYVNDEFVELTGYPREEIIGRNCRFLQGEGTREEPVAEMREAIDAEKPVTVELRNYHKDGTMFWNRVTISPVRDETGDVTHFLGFQEDISETKAYEQERTLFEKHAEASDQVMFVTDTDGRIEYVNPAFECVTGYAASEAIGKTPRLLNSGQQDESFYEELWETIGTGEIWEGTLTNQTKHGELYQVALTIIPIVDDRGEITHFTAIERDISEEKLTEQVLDVLNRVLRHNVRTSIDVIEGYAECLQTELEDDEKRAATRAIRERARDLRKLNEQLTAIRGLLEGKSEPSPLGLSQIERIVERAKTTYENAQITLQIEAEPEETIKNGDVFQIALDTAIENAVVHNDQETPRIMITVHETTDDETVTVEIVDDGPGVPKPEWEIVKAGTETPLNHTSGIGLWILYWAVTAMGGTVGLADNEPRGTVLTLEIPLTPDSANGHLTAE